MLKYIFVAAIIFITAASSTAQQSLLFSMGYEYTSLDYYKFQQNGNVLQRGGAGYYTTNYGVSARLRYRLNIYFGFEVNYTKTTYCLGVHDEQYVKLNNVEPPNKTNHFIGSQYDGQPGYLGAYKHYYSPGAALCFYFPIFHSDYEMERPSLSFYLAYGTMFNFRYPGAQYLNTYTDDAKNETLTLTTNYSKYFNTRYIDAGISGTMEGGFTFGIDVKYTYGGQVLTANYTDVVDGKAVNSDKVTDLAGYFLWDLRGGIILMDKERSEKKKERRRIRREQRQQNIVAKAETPPKKVPEHADKDLYNRVIVVADSIKVNNTDLVIKVWDDGTVDGDIISLNLNGEWILTDYTLKTEKETITVSLHKGDNSLVLYTEDEGRFKPCTAAFLIIDGNYEQRIVLSSNFQKSSSLILKNGD